MENQQLILNEDYMQLLKNAPAPADLTTSEIKSSTSINPIFILLAIGFTVVIVIKINESIKKQSNVYKN